MLLFCHQVGKTHEEMDKIARMLPYVSHKDEIVEVMEPIDPSKLLPGKFYSNNYSHFLGLYKSWIEKIIFTLSWSILHFWGFHDKEFWNETIRH